MAVVVTALVGGFLIAFIVLMVRRRARRHRHLSREKPDLLDKEDDYEVVQYPEDRDQATESTPLAAGGEHVAQAIPSLTRYVEFPSGVSCTLISDTRNAPGNTSAVNLQNAHGIEELPPDYFEATGSAPKPRL